MGDHFHIEMGAEEMILMANAFEGEERSTVQLKRKLSLQLYKALQQRKEEELRSVLEAIYWQRYDLQEICSLVGNDGKSPIRAAIVEAHGDTSLIKALVKRGVNFDVRIGTDAVTVLHLAVIAQDKVILKYLINRRVVDINEGDVHNQTALHYAIQSKSASLCATLLKHHIDVNSKDVLNQTALHLAMQPLIEKPDMKVSFLCKAHADVNIQDIDGNTPMHILMTKKPANFLYMAELLLKQGYNIDIVNQDGNSAWDLYIKNPIYDVVITETIRKKLTRTRSNSLPIIVNTLHLENNETGDENENTNNNGPTRRSTLQIPPVGRSSHKRTGSLDLLKKAMRRISTGSSRRASTATTLSYISEDGDRKADNDDDYQLPSEEERLRLARAFDLARSDASSQDEYEDSSVYNDGSLYSVGVDNEENKTPKVEAYHSTDEESEHDYEEIDVPSKESTEQETTKPSKIAEIPPFRGSNTIDFTLNRGVSTSVLSDQDSKEKVKEWIRRQWSAPVDYDMLEIGDGESNGERARRIGIPDLTLHFHESLDTNESPVDESPLVDESSLFEESPTVESKAVENSLSREENLHNEQTLKVENRSESTCSSSDSDEIKEKITITECETRVNKLSNATATTVVGEVVRSRSDTLLYGAHHQPERVEVTFDQTDSVINQLAEKSEAYSHPDIEDDERILEALKHENEQECLKILAHLEKERLHELHDECNDTLLHIATDRGQLRVVTFLLSQEADVNAVNYELESCLHIAAASASRLPILKLLLAKGAMREVTTIDDKTPFHLGIEKRLPSTLEVLLTDCELQPNLLESLLYQVICMSERSDLMKGLFRYIGARLDDPNIHLVVPLSAKNKHWKLLGFLIKKTGKKKILLCLDKRDEDGWAALHYAAKHNQLHIIKLIHKYGGRIHRKIKGKKSATARTIAHQNGYTDIIEFIDSVPAGRH